MSAAAILKAKHAFHSSMMCFESQAEHAPPPGLRWLEVLFFDGLSQSLRHGGGDWIVNRVMAQQFFGRVELEGTLLLRRLLVGGSLFRFLLAESGVAKVHVGFRRFG
jgi:hypothetical protein